MEAGTCWVHSIEVRLHPTSLTTEPTFMIADRHTKFVEDIRSPTGEKSCAGPEKVLESAYKENLGDD